ncbi:hypothetical protein TKK_0005362 [Trichogramma kaykai]|uniref:ubiquitinyl hydrolase 1 n=1 Tax=Trichogramma kaykai TaxID=54128 RepID=A0ABD2XJF8_9HYME
MDDMNSRLHKLNIQDNYKAKYYVVKQTTLLKHLKGNCNANIGRAVPGMLVIAIATEDDGLRVIVLEEFTDDITSDNKWFNTEWKCHPVDLIQVSWFVWQLLRPISSFQERVRLANNKELCKDVENIKPESKVWYCPESNDLTPKTYEATVNFIEHVPELGFGLFFGLDVPDNPNDIEHKKLIQKYFNTLERSKTFATLSSINPRKASPLEAIKEFQKNFLSHDILQHEKSNLFIPTNREYSENRRNPSTTYTSTTFLNLPQKITDPYYGLPYESQKSTNSFPLHNLQKSQTFQYNSQKNSNAPLPLNAQSVQRIANSNPYNILQTNQYSVLSDKDNNNGITAPRESVVNTIKNYPLKSQIHLEQNDNKTLYKNVKSFDPLISDDEVDEIPKINHQQLQNTRDLSIGSCVKVLVDNDSHYGVIRWIGTIDRLNPNKLTAAIELDNIHPLATDGTYQNVRYFQCSPRKAWFTDLKDCHEYDMAASNCYYNQQDLNDFESIPSSIITGTVPPICVNGNLEKMCGKYRGIQGHHNSCYLDSTLFSMFAFTCAFDELLFRPPNDKDCPEYEEVQRILREEIVNPLRKDLFVRSDRVMKLRTLLEKSSSISGLTTEEKDPEEFLTSLVAQTLKAEPFLKLSSGQDAYHYQLFVDKDEKLVFPSVQQLLEQSFLQSNIKLKTAPSCLIIQMPRFGKTFKMYPKIQPTLLLDITDIVEDAPRWCTVCGKLAHFECKDCYGQCGEGLESIAFCKPCLKKAHSHELRTNHEPKTLTIAPAAYDATNNYSSVPRRYLELLAVVCIETSHYVSFVKCGSGFEAPWCFFDSMADRKGEQNGYNIPEMVPCPDFPYWLSEEGAKYLRTVSDDRVLPEHAKRLLCDAYMCMYQTPDLMVHK